MFEAIYEDFKKKFEKTKSWVIGSADWPVFQKQNDLKMAALDELTDLFGKVGEEKFLDLAKTSISLDSYKCDPTKLFGLIKDKEMERVYYLKIAEVNKEFLTSILEDIPIETTVRFLSESIGSANISKEMIESMKYSPDAPKEYRNSLKTGNWEGTDQKQLPKKNWYDLEEPTISDCIQEADTLALQDDVYSAIKIYEKLEATNDILVKLILCNLKCLDFNRVEYLLYHRLDRFDPYYEFLEKLLDSVRKYHEPKYKKILREYEHLINNDWMVTILLRIENKVWRS